MEKSGRVLFAAGVSAALAAGMFAAPAHAAQDPLDHLSVTGSAVSSVHAFVRSHPGDFGGSYEDSQTRTVHVLTLDGASGRQARSALAGAATAASTRARASTRVSPDGDTGNWTVVADPARYSMTALRQVRDEVSGDFARQAGAHLTIWYADPRTDTVHIGLDQVTPGLVELARQEFGDKVTVSQEQRHQFMDKRVKAKGPVAFSHDAAPAAAAAPTAGQGGAAPAATTPSRLLDSEPYAGGDRIVSTQAINGDTYIVQCTVNFDYLTSSGAPAMGTAGHCGPTGQNWYQGYFDDSTQTVHYTGTMGSAYTRIWGNGKTDAELLDDSGNPGGFWPQVYTTNTALADVGSVSPVSVGQKACADGSFTLESCYGVIKSVDVCLNINDDGTIVKVCNLDVANGVGGTLVQSGDSGGPVYTSGSPHRPMGIISAGTADGLTLDFADMGDVDITLGGHPEPSS